MSLGDSRQEYEEIIRALEAARCCRLQVLQKDKEVLFFLLVEIAPFEVCYNWARLDSQKLHNIHKHKKASKRQQHDRRVDFLLEQLSPYPQILQELHIDPHKDKTK